MKKKKEGKNKKQRMKENKQAEKPAAKRRK